MSLAGTVPAGWLAGAPANDVYMDISLEYSDPALAKITRSPGFPSYVNYSSSLFSSCHLELGFICNYKNPD